MRACRERRGAAARLRAALDFELNAADAPVPRARGYPIVKGGRPGSGSPWNGDPALDYASPPAPQLGPSGQFLEIDPARQADCS
jgi:hypothetical protein